MEDEHNTDSETDILICRSTASPQLSPQDDNYIADLNDVEDKDVIFASQADAKDEDTIESETVSLTRHPAPTPHLTPPQDDNQIVDLDSTETEDVIFASQIGVVDDHSTVTGVVGAIRCSTPVSHFTSPQDVNHIVDDTETGGISFVAQADEEGGDGTGPEAVGLVCRSTSVPHLSSPQDSNCIMDLDDAEARDVVFASQKEAEDEYNIESETVNYIRRSTPVPSSLLSSGRPHHGSRRY